MIYPKYLFNTKESNEWDTEKQRREETETNSKMENVNPNILWITVNVNGLNIPNEEWRDSDWIQKARSKHMLYARDTLRFRDRTRLKVERWKKIHCEKSDHKKVAWPMWILAKIDVKTINITRNKNRCFLVIKESIDQESTKPHLQIRSHGVIFKLWIVEGALFKPQQIQMSSNLRGKTSCSISI